MIEVMGRFCLCIYIYICESSVHSYECGLDSQGSECGQNRRELSTGLYVVVYRM